MYKHFLQVSELHRVCKTAARLSQVEEPLFCICAIRITKLVRNRPFLAGSPIVKLFEMVKSQIHLKYRKLVTNVKWRRSPVFNNAKDI